MDTEERDWLGRTAYELANRALNETCIVPERGGPLEFLPWDELPPPEREYWYRMAETFARIVLERGALTMGLHLCPIEPDDWSNGPGDPDGVECPECGGEGTIVADSPAAHDLEVTCPRCGGSGFVDPPEPDWGD